MNQTQIANAVDVAKERWTITDMPEAEELFPRVELSAATAWSPLDGELESYVPDFNTTPMILSNEATRSFAEQHFKKLNNVTLSDDWAFYTGIIEVPKDEYLENQRSTAGLTGDDFTLLAQDLEGRDTVSVLSDFSYGSSKVSPEFNPANTLRRKMFAEFTPNELFQELLSSGTESDALLSVMETKQHAIEARHEAELNAERRGYRVTASGLRIPIPTGSPGI